MDAIVPLDVQQYIFDPQASVMNPYIDCEIARPSGKAIMLLLIAAAIIGCGKDTLISIADLEKELDATFTPAIPSSEIVAHKQLLVPEKSQLKLGFIKLTD